MSVMERRWEYPRKRRSGAPHCAVVYKGSCWRTYWYLSHFYYGWPPVWLLNVLKKRKKATEKLRTKSNLEPWVLDVLHNVKSRGPSCSVCTMLGFCVGHVQSHSLNTCSHELSFVHISSYIRAFRLHRHICKGILADPQGLKIVWTLADRKWITWAPSTAHKMCECTFLEFLVNNLVTLLLIIYTINKLIYVCCHVQSIYLSQV